MLKSRETFVFEGLNVTVERKNFLFGKEMVFIIHDGDEELRLHDYYPDGDPHRDYPRGDLRGMFSKIVACRNKQEILHIEKGSYAGIENPSLDHGIERWVPLVKELYAAYRQHSLPRTEGFLNHFQDRTNLAQLLEKNRERLFVETLPEMADRYENRGQNSITVSAETQVIRALPTNLPQQLIDLEQQYRDSADRKAKQLGLTQIVAQVNALGNNYVASVTNFQITYAGFDFDEQVLPLTVESLTSRLMERSSGVLGSGSVKEGSSNGQKHEHYKTTRYRVTEKIHFTLYQKKELARTTTPLGLEERV